MIAKMITYGKDRDEAIDRMVRAIDEYQITGVSSTLGFCKFAIQHEAFRSGHFDTHFVQNYFKPEYLDNQDDNAEEIGAIIATSLFDKGNSSNASAAIKTTQQKSSWKLRRSN